MKQIKIIVHQQLLQTLKNKWKKIVSINRVTLIGYLKKKPEIGYMQI